ncbi:flagellar type III secretion system pore protein FliP [Photobacterium kishitanii]|nr:flagellar type III secretion system pore protein FliP [Photobacterium kishitanii]
MKLKKLLSTDCFVKKSPITLLIGILVLLVPSVALAAPELELITSTTGAGDTTSYSAPMNMLLLMSVWGLVVPVILCMTPFLRLTIVFSVMRSAMGLNSVPSSKVLAAMALIVSMFIMNPVLTKVYDNAYLPYSNSEIGAPQALDAAMKPMRTFMLNQTRPEYLKAFLEMSGEAYTTKEKVSYPVLIVSYMVSELQTGLTIGFFLYVPFVVVDLIVSSILMALGMMMVSPMIISTPIKIILFVLCHGWLYVIDGVSKSFFLGGI